VLSCVIGLVRYRDCARFTLCAIGTCAIGLVRYRELCQFFVCYRVGALSHRALTGPSRPYRAAEKRYGARIHSVERGRAGRGRGVSPRVLRAPSAVVGAACRRLRPSYDGLNNRLISRRGAPLPLSGGCFPGDSFRLLFGRE